MDEDVNGDTTTDEEGFPLPSVIFVTQSVIDQQDGHQDSGDDHQDETEEEEPEHVVNSVEPDRVVNEIHLNCNGTKWEDTCDQRQWDSSQIPRLSWDLSWDLVHLDGQSGQRSSVRQQRAQYGEWDADQEPDEDNGEHGTDWYGT